MILMAMVFVDADAEVGCTNEFGCTDYDSLATDEGDCTFVDVEGCT